MNCKLIFVTLCLISGIAQSAELPSSQIEVLQTKAVLQYHSKQYAASEATLSKILESDPSNTAALELKALNLRARKDDEGATKVYETLLQKGKDSQLPAYHFELAMIRYKQKKLRDAELHFEKAADGHFNAGTSNFFLGVMSFNDKNWLRARSKFSASLAYDDGKPMAYVSRYYLASAYSQLGKADSAIVNYNQASTEANKESAKTNSLSAEIKRNAIKELKALDKNQTFINISMLTQWDTNVQTNPSEVNNPVAASSQRSIKGIIAATVGYASSPVAHFQVIPSYRFYTNYNAHYLATDFNFITHSADLYVLYNSYERLSYGLKGAGTYSMKNNLLPTDSRRALHYRSYSLVGDVGPVARYELTPQIMVNAMATWHPQKFYTDPAGGDNVRSGDGLYTLVSTEFITRYWWFNPIPYFSYSWDVSKGKNFRVYTTGFGISNPLKLSDRLTVTPGLDFTSSDYYETRSPNDREDTNITVKTAGTYTINNNWTATADISWINNNSSIPTSYKYTRLVLTGGATYNF